MSKKLTIACMAIAAFAAFVIAPAASASPVLTDDGHAIHVGNSITGDDTGPTLFSGGFNVTCSNDHIVGTLIQSGTPFRIRVEPGGVVLTGSGSGGDCTSALGDVKPTVNSALCLESITGTDNIKITGCTGALTFTLNVTSAGVTCPYSAASVTGTFKTNAGATVNVISQPATREGTNIFCPSSGSLTVDYDFYTTDGTALTIS